MDPLSKEARVFFLQMWCKTDTHTQVFTILWEAAA